VIARLPWLAPALWTAFIAWPARGWGLLEGLPLQPFAVASIACVWFVWTLGHRGWRPLVPLALLVLKAALGLFAFAERGLVASYFANPTFERPAERSVDFPQARFTRVDRVIDFGPAADRDFPLFFLNDVDRFNGNPPGNINRAALPFSAEWSGNLRVAEDEAPTAFVDGSGVRAELVIDGVVILTLDSDATDSRRPIGLSAGWHRLQIRAARPPGLPAARSLYVGRIGRDGIDRPFTSDDLFVRRASTARLRLDAGARAASRAIDGVVFAWFLVRAVLIVVGRGVRREWARLALAGLTAAALVDAWRFALPIRDRLLTLNGGDDPLLYESYARDILFHGPLMTLGGSVGHGAPFYFQPLYPYALAVMHGVLGEGFFGVLFVQRLLVGLTVVLVWKISRELFGDRVGMVAFGVAAAFLYDRLGPWAGRLFGEIVFVPLAAWAVLGAVRLGATEPSGGETGGPGPRSAWWAGLAYGLAMLSRSTLLAAFPVILAILAVARRRAGRPVRTLATMTMVALAVLGLATVRNWIVSRSFSPIPTSFAVNLFLGNQPPDGIVIPPRDDYLGSVIAYARLAPAPFLRHLCDKALFAAGFFGALAPGIRTDALLVITWVTALVGAIVAARRQVRDRLFRWAFCIPAAVAATQFVVLVVIFPNAANGDRLILPLYVLLLPYAAAAAQPLFDAANTVLDEVVLAVNGVRRN
jgi:hypothetical protein